ncbi:hypothetical protein B0H10DRAFT_1771289, partial [Mycena sp. CBHHK59/15]
SEVAKILAAAKDLSQERYTMLLEYLNSIGQPWRSWDQIPHPTGSLVLYPRAMQPQQFKADGWTFSCHKSHKGNSGIQFKNPIGLTPLTGFIEEIWQMPLQNHMQTFILVRTHKALPNSLAARTPFVSMPYFSVAAVDAAPSSELCVIEPRHIITHLTIYKRPKGTYGINRDILVVCWALNRGRHS